MDKLKSMLSGHHEKKEEATHGSGTQNTDTSSYGGRDAIQSTDHTSGRSAGTGNHHYAYGTEAGGSAADNPDAAMHHGNQTLGEHIDYNDDSTLYSTPAAKKDHGVMRQILNPGGHKYDELAYGDTASTDPQAAATGRELRPTVTDPSSGVGNTTSLPDRTNTGAHDSHLGRDAALAGGAGAAGLEYEKVKWQGNDYQTGSTGGVTGSSQPTGERSFPLSGGSGNNTTGTHDSHLGRDAALAGGAGLGGYEAEKHHHHHHHHGGDAQNLGSGSTIGSGNTGYDTGSSGLEQRIGGHHPGEQPAEGYVHHVHGPHSTDIANLLDPHVSGGQSVTSGQGNLGRDAAVAGGVGAAGLGGYEAEKHHHHHHHNQPSTTTGGLGSSTGIEQPREHHYGRDAALVGGGAGAAGLGAHELGKHHHQHETPLTGASGYDDQRFDPNATHGASSGLQSGNQASSIGYPSSTSQPSGGMTGGVDTGPASSTIGPHSSNLANIVDPRVRPDPEKMKATEDQKQHHYGRDAALAGGAGAAGVGAYEYGRDDPSRLGAGQTAQQPLATPTGAPRDARIFDQTQTVPESKQAPAGWAADTKAQEKLAHQHDKELKKEEKHAQKEHDKHEKHEDKEKKGGLLGFLKGHKSHDTPEEQELKNEGNYREADLAAHERHQRELERDAAVGTTGVAGAAFEPNLRDQQYSDTTSSHPGVATDSHGHNKLHKDPPASVQRELDERAREQQGLGQDDSLVGSGQDYYVTDPRTGLKMNVGKYGSGAGGTDSNQPIHGYHQQ